MISTGTSGTYGRVPTKFLDYAQRDKAQPGEVMMDYTPGDQFGHLYMKSRTTSDILDLKQKIDDITPETAAEIKINIDGEISTLYDLLYTLKMDLGTGIKAVPAGTDIVYIQKQYAFDQVSLETTANSVQIRGFDTANNVQVPMKLNGVLQWVSPSDLSSLANNGVDTNPVDGQVSNIIEIYPLNNTIYLLASKRHLTKYLTANCIIELPETLDAYVEIEWCLVTNSFAPVLSFPDNTISWRTGAPTISGNHTYVFMFKTWNNGQTWIADVETYTN